MRHWDIHKISTVYRLTKRYMAPLFKNAQEAPSQTYLNTTSLYESHPLVHSLINIYQIEKTFTPYHTIIFSASSSQPAPHWRNSDIRQPVTLHIDSSMHQSRLSKHSPSLPLNIQIQTSLKNTPHYYQELFQHTATADTTGKRGQIQSSFLRWIEALPYRWCGTKESSDVQQH